VLLYASCQGEHSSRRIERRLQEDVDFLVVAANQQLDHATVARSRCRHEEAIAGVFSQVLGLRGRCTYARCKITTEPVFGSIKANLRSRRSSGRRLVAVQSEWRFIWAVHNLMRLRATHLVLG